MYRLWWLIPSVILSGCFGTKQVEIFDIPEAREPIPNDAMEQCEPTLSELPDNFAEIAVAEAVEILAINHAVDATFYFECKRKQEELTGWIERNP
jgi:hypothetical protein